MVLEGRPVNGTGRGARFTRLDWVRSQLLETVGIDPFPGTFNLHLDDGEDQVRWREWSNIPGFTLEPVDTGFCRARCYPVQVMGNIPAAVLLPQVPDYPADQVELVAALPLRMQPSFSPASTVRVELCAPLAVKAVLFDLDGTLVDSVAAYIQVAQVAAAPFGFQVTEEQVRTALANGTSFWRGAVPKDRPDVDAVVRAIAAQAYQEWPRILQEQGKLFDGILQTLDALKEMGIKLGIVSGARQEVLELLRPEGILDRFDAVVLGPDVPTRKPDPEGILKCLGMLNILPAGALYVGDAPIDIMASRAAGVRAVGVLTGAGDSATLSSYYPDRLISSHLHLPSIVELA